MLSSLVSKTMILYVWIAYLVSFVAVNSQSSFRLPTTIRPTHYTLILHPNLEAGTYGTFTGEEWIEIEIDASYFANTDGDFDVSFNYFPSNNMDIDISSASLTVNYTMNATDMSGVYPLRNLSLDATTQIAVATFNVSKLKMQEAYGVDGNFSLYMSYSADIRGGSDLAGWYRSSYEYTSPEGDNFAVHNLVTQFQPTDARSVFPCFDEPDFKATFDITFIAPVDAVTLSNMPILQNTSEPGSCPWNNTNNENKDECKRVQFMQTPKMSTYLLAFVIGGYAATDAAGGVPQTVYYPYTFDEDNAIFARGESIDVLTIFDDEFGIPFTDSGIPKLDSIGVSDFAAGAMENWGLVVYRTVRLLVSRNESSQAALSRQILIIAHELAHQWFGNLVSPQWWDDLWLNEGFATWMAYYGANLQQPEYSVLDLKMQALSDVMIDDASIYTEPVLLDIDGDPTQILSSFSSITYQKGMGVINTMSNTMGYTNFINGISSYLRMYEFDTANSSQLGDVLEAANNGEGIKAIMESFITERGFPLITVDLTGEDDNNYEFTLTQQRFVQEGPFFYDNQGSALPFVPDGMVQAFEDQVWRIPLKYRLSSLAENNEDGGTMTTQSMTLSVAKDDYFLLNPIDVNDGTPGLYNFFRANYDDATLNMLLDNFGDLEPPDQFAIISDRYALMISSYITPQSYLEFLRSAVDKILDGKTKGVAEDLPDYTTWNTIMQSLISIDDILCELIFDPFGGDTTPADDTSIRLYFRDLAQEILRKALWYLVEDMDTPFCDNGDCTECDPDEDPNCDDGSDDDETPPCPEGADCNILRGTLLQGLVRLGDEDIIAEAYRIFYECANQECSEPRCVGCTGPKVHDGRISFVSDDVFQAMIAGVLSLDPSSNEDLTNIKALYSRVNIEQQTYILNALGALYVDTDGNLIREALEFVDSDAVRSNMKISAFVAMKQCSARDPLWEWMTTNATVPDGRTPFDRYMTGSGLFSQEPLTALPNGFASESKYDQVTEFFAANASRVNAGTEKSLNQTLENVYTRYLWKNANYDGLQLYLRTYVVQKYQEGLDVWQIILITVLCSGGLIVMVCAFWAGSKPTDTDRFEYYMSMKHNKRERRKSSQIGAAPHALTSSLGHSLDRSLRANSHMNNNNNDNVVDIADEGGAAKRRGKSKNRDVEEEESGAQTELQTTGGSTNAATAGGDAGGYGATEAFNYSSLKEADQHTS